MTATRSLSDTVQHLARTLAARELASLADAELVRRFAERRDEAAFAALVRRHGPVVLGVCRRVLRHEQDAEDAFQAAFLVLARKAAAVRRAGAVGNWLYGVAYNVARKARAVRQRREVKERQAAARPAAGAAVSDEVREFVDAELRALPELYRSAIVLCDLRGLTIREAAAEAGCPPKTLGTRLSRGRSLLARRLTRRGLAVSAGALAAALAPEAPAAALARLLGPTVRAAARLATGSAAAISPSVAALTQGVSNVMAPKLLKSVVLMTCTVLALAGVAVASRSGSPGGSNRSAVAAAPSPAEEAAPVAPQNIKPARAADHWEELHRHLHGLFMALVAPAAGLWHGDPNVAETDADKDRPALSGTWAQKGGAVKIEFPEKRVMKISAHDGGLVITCEYAVDKEGLVKAKVTDLGGNQELIEKVKDKIPVGLKFSFRWKAKGGAAKLEDLSGDNTEPLKAHLEGEFEEAK